MRRVDRVVIAAVIGGLALGVASLLVEEDALRLTELSRSSVSTGVEMVEGTLDRGREESRFVALFIDPRTVTSAITINDLKLPLEKLSPKATIVSNGGYFTREGKPTGLLYASGQVLAPFVPSGGGAGSGILVVKGGEVALFPRDGFEREDFEGASLAIQAGPRIIEPGGRPGIHSDDGLRANRTVIGRDGRGRLAIAVVYGAPANGAGITLHELQSILGPEGIGGLFPELVFTIALNLDGGPSTGLVVRGEKSLELEETSRVHNALCFGRCIEASK